MPFRCSVGWLTCLPFASISCDESGTIVIVTSILLKHSRSTSVLDQNIPLKFSFDKSDVFAPFRVSAEALIGDTAYGISSNQM